MRSDLFVYTSLQDPRALPLIEELGREYESRYGDFYLQESAVPEIERYPAEVFTPAQGGNFLLLLRKGRAVAGGAFKRLDADTAEFKRIWTDSSLRRQGLARSVLVELEAQALRQGYQRVYLTTGFRQPEAVGLYLGHGYRRLFDPTADLQALRKLPFEKQLSLAPRSHSPLPSTHPLQAPMLSGV
ncbi:GNAT family N-acetyltransferase [Comamonas koreensis]|uniref:GNAT family N-acetyltransferase n=1 Tax=Comamonas koreensis TaxID=160825 RepID=A0AAW4XUD8_9BURK|nr:GNAT family N-acetyltransferase [Comamonas koreensis]MCD2164703.1 GNAT family N-acetyltransferase [Comamonas koreensis]